MLCGQDYGPATLERLQPHIMNAYIQNHRLNPDGTDCLPTYCLGDVRYDHVPVWEDSGLDTSSVFSGLKQISYDGYFTIHQAEGIETLDGRQSLREALLGLRSQISRNVTKPSTFTDCNEFDETVRSSF